MGSKLFWTWMAYYFCCFGGKKSQCKCYICLCNLAVCKKRIKANRKVMQYMFAAAKKIQYKRHMDRMMVTTVHSGAKMNGIEEVDEEDSSKEIKKRFQTTGNFTKQISDFDDKEFR